MEREKRKERKVGLRDGEIEKEREKGRVERWRERKGKREG